MQRRFLLLFVSVLVIGCAEELPEEKPKAPNMEPLYQDYQMPTAPLTVETAPLIMESLFQVIPQAGYFCGWTTLEDMNCGGQGCDCEGIASIRELLDSVNTTQATTQELEYQTRSQALMVGSMEVEGDGFFAITRICDGGDATQPADADKNGLIDMVLGFSAESVDRVVWGKFKQCNMTIGAQSLLIDSELNVRWDGDFDLAALTNLSFLVELRGTVTLAEQVYDLQTDFNALSTGEFELRLPVGEEHVIFYTTLASGGASALVQGFRAANGNWTCDFAAMTCQDEAGNSVGL